MENWFGETPHATDEFIPRTMANPKAMAKTLRTAWDSIDSNMLYGVTLLIEAARSTGYEEGFNACWEDEGKRS